MTPYLVVRRRLPNRGKLRSPQLFFQLLAAGLLLCANYGLYVFGLQRTSPEAAQVMIQIAPMLLLLAGVFLFKEHFSSAQWFGFFAFASGLVLFFNHHLGAGKSEIVIQRSSARTDTFELNDTHLVVTAHLAE